MYLYMFIHIYIYIYIDADRTLDPKPQTQIAKRAFWWHKNIGTYGKFIIPVIP